MQKALNKVVQFGRIFFLCDGTYLLIMRLVVIWQKIQFHMGNLVSFLRVSKKKSNGTYA